ncbi:hypothetical protein D3C81_190540 [compost metagenome]
MGSQGEPLATFITFWTRDGGVLTRQAALARNTGRTGVLPSVEVRVPDRQVADLTIGDQPSITCGASRMSGLQRGHRWEQTENRHQRARRTVFTLDTLRTDVVDRIRPDTVYLHVAELGVCDIPQIPFFDIVQVWQAANSRHRATRFHGGAHRANLALVTFELTGILPGVRDVYPDVLIEVEVGFAQELVDRVWNNLIFFGEDLDDVERLTIFTGRTIFTVGTQIQPGTFHPTVERVVLTDSPNVLSHVTNRRQFRDQVQRTFQGDGLTISTFEVSPESRQRLTLMAIFLPDLVSRLTVHTTPWTKINPTVRVGQVDPQVPSIQQRISVLVFRTLYRRQCIFVGEGADDAEVTTVVTLRTGHLRVVTLRTDQRSQELDFSLALVLRNQEPLLVSRHTLNTRDHDVIRIRLYPHEQVDTDVPGFGFITRTWECASVSLDTRYHVRSTRIALLTLFTTDKLDPHGVGLTAVTR